MMEIFTLLLFCVVLVLPTEGAELENREIIKTVHRRPNLSILQATHGGQSDVTFLKSPKSLVSDPGSTRPKSSFLSAPIPPSFVRSAQVHSAQSFFRTRLSSKPKRWALSTTYEPQTEEIVDDDDENDENDEWNSPYSEDRERNEVETEQDTSVEPDFTHQAENKNRVMEEEEEEGENEVVSAYNFEPTYAEPFEPEDHEKRISQDYLPGRETSFEYRPVETESYKVVMEEEHQEPVRPVRRSQSPWAYRDVDRMGSPRHAACTMPLDRGVGPDELSAWYFDQSENKCRWFGYQGHGGNANRFYSRIVCEAYCIQDLDDLCQAVTCPSSGLTCRLVDDEDCKQNEQRYGRDWRVKCPPNHPVCVSARNTRIAPNTSVQPIPPECYQPKDSGSCQRKNPAVNFYYDSERNTCMTFYFHTCGGNDNRFETKSDCMTHCSP